MLLCLLSFEFSKKENLFSKQTFQDDRGCQWSVCHAPGSTGLLVLQGHPHIEGTDAGLMLTLSLISLGFWRYQTKMMALALEGVTLIAPGPVLALLPNL